MSFDGVQEVASSGCGVPSAPTCVRKFRHGKTVMMPPLEVNLWGLTSTAGEPVTRMVPPRRGCAAAGAAVAASVAATAGAAAVAASVGAPAGGRVAAGAAAAVGL